MLFRSPSLDAQAAFDAAGTRVGERAGEWVIGAQARWSWSIGGAESAAIRAAGDAEARSQAEADDTRAAIQVEVVTALRRLQAAKARIAASRAAVDQARERQRIVRNRVDAGLAGTTDLLNASSGLLEAELLRTSAPRRVRVRRA